ncbi:MAG: HD domain-containing protein [Lachnospiraceae bacterium]|nr:HD domain-containing protein [Lachnospiraceae bacterium]
MRKEFEHKIAEITKCMKKKLDDKRYLHTLSVAYTAGCMAMRYGYDPYKAYLAGLLHDNAKCITHGKKLSLCAKFGLEISPVERENPDLLHARLGSFLAREKYEVEDEDIISAIAYHTTGKPDMTMLEKIIYISDYIEIHRKPLPNMEEIRTLAFSDIDACMLRILESTITYLTEKKADIDEITLETYDFYKKLL